MSARTPSVGERSAMDDIAKAPERSPSVASHRSSSTQSGSTSSSSCASSSEEPGSNDENDDEKEPVSDFHAIELQDEVADQKTLEARFTDKQLKYLESRRNEYRYASAAQRREIAAATGKMFAKKVQDKRTERAKKKREAGNVNLSEDASKAVDLSKDDIKAIHDVSTPFQCFRGHVFQLWSPFIERQKVVCATCSNTERANALDHQLDGTPSLLQGKHRPCPRDPESIVQDR